MLVFILVLNVHSNFVLQQANALKHFVLSYDIVFNHNKLKDGTNAYYAACCGYFHHNDVLIKT